MPYCLSIFKILLCSRITQNKDFAPSALVGVIQRLAVYNRTRTEKKYTHAAYGAKNYIYASYVKYHMIYL